MKIHVGSQNKIEIQAVREAVTMYPNLFPEPEVEGIDVSVDTFGHPKKLDETVQGAIQRAKASYEGSHCSFGIEGGLMEVPHTKTGYMEVGACAIYNGKDIFLGLSPAFEWPKNVNDFILEGKGDASLAFKQFGYTHHEKLGKETGELSGDGPLTAKGIADVTDSAHNFAETLLQWGCNHIDLAVVSGSIRCAETIAIIWRILHENCITIGVCDMRKDYFSTVEEDRGWAELYANHKSELLQRIAEVGEKKAVLEYAADLVRPCAERTIARVEKGVADGCRSFIVVTHAPHDTIIEGHFSLVEMSQSHTNCLEQGKYWMFGI